MNTQRFSTWSHFLNSSLYISCIYHGKIPQFSFILIILTTDVLLITSLTLALTSVAQWVGHLLAKVTGSAFLVTSTMSLCF